HCPIQAVAAEFPEICEAELAMFSDYLGVDVRRLSSLAQGDHVCTTHIPTSELTRPLIHSNDRPQGGSRGLTQAIGSSMRIPSSRTSGSTHTVGVTKTTRD